MLTVVRSAELPASGRTALFEGEGYGSGVSFFLVDTPPGGGPVLHKHPYSETWVVRAGAVRITADGVDTLAGPGDIAVVPPETPHKFLNVGEDRLEMICIHASPRILQENLEER
ncbi:cupin domain-containing protein [Actinotalea sp. BY-33]|uniref:Cupin domain-containing protein n=1 Tax=Actinotalea soli TaxID=2819234 RepID=A0A939RWS9_9CELL|nr:cupin domain-containing protein [Actinotalea soli]MBO1752486.1 cupin domain-containing protein [Actinotalea soli]